MTTPKNKRDKDYFVFSVNEILPMTIKEARRIKKEKEKEIAKWIEENKKKDDG